MSVTLAVDAIGANVSAIPKGMQACGYTTGTGVVPWTTADWAAHPGAVRICQDPGLSDRTADVADVEAGAGTLGAVAAWARGALASYAAARRPGQRVPAVYMSASNVTAVVNALVAGGIKSGVALWIANWNLTEAQAQADVQGAAGPFPVIGFQYHSGTALDFDVFSTAWLQDVSGKAKPPPDPGTGSQQVPAPAAPQVVTTGGNQSLRNFAHYHSMTPQSVIWLTAVQKSVGGFGTGQGAYISGGNWDENMPDGSTWWIGPTP